MSEGSHDTDSIIGRKSYAFALQIINLYKELVHDKKEFVLSKQLLRAGTSVGANVNEAVSASSKRDFIHKLSIALKEARETHYWLRLLKDSSYINGEIFGTLNTLCMEIIKLLSSIILTTRQRYFGNANPTHNS